MKASRTSSPLAVGSLTVELRFHGDYLAGVKLPARPPATMTRQVLVDLVKRLQGMPLELPDAAPFTRRVWSLLQEIPFGQTITYAELALKAGSPRGARAAGGACAANQLPVIIPCHRVVASHGLGGYAYGLEWKRTLLELEGGCRCHL